MEVVLESNIMSAHIKAFLDDPQWPKHIQDPLLRMCNGTWSFSS